MTEETGAAAPATELAPAAPAATEQATPPASVPKDDAAPENAETQETAPEAEDSEPKRLTRQQRLQRKAARLSTMVAEQAAELEKLRQMTQKNNAESEPKEADYNGDWTKYQADYAAWKAAQIIESKLVDREQRDLTRQLQDRQREATEEFEVRASEVAKSIPDYNATIEAFVSKGGKFAPHVIEEVRDSEKGPMLAYQLAKSPDLVAELNAMSPRDVAREIGRLESRLSLPEPRKQTKAPAPLAPVKGGAAPATDLASLAKNDDASAYWAARKAQQKARA